MRPNCRTWQARRVQPAEHGAEQCLHCSAHFDARRDAFDRFQQPLDDVVDGDAFGFGAVVEQDAMAKRRDARAPECLRMVTCARPCSSARTFAPSTRNWPARSARAPAHPVVDEIRRARLMRARCRGEPHGVADQVLGDRHFADDFVKAQHVLAGEQRLDASGCRAVVCLTTATSSSSGR